MGIACSELMQRHADGAGLGEMMMAHRLAAAFDSTLDRMLEAKQSGLGWGQIGHAHALAKAEIFTFEDALDRLQGDPDWDELRAHAGLSEGPPPWAGRPAWAGRPPWAGRGVDAEIDDTDDDLGGPPPWAGGRFGLAGPGRGR